MSVIKGIDVSVWNGTIDWTKASKKIDFAIIRAGYGKLISQKDKKFDENYVNAQKNNVPVGAYWYNYATTVEEAKTEANVCLQVLNGKKFDYPIWYDVEENATFAKGKTTVSKIIDAFLTIIKEAGYKVGVYSSYNGLTNYVNATIKKKYDVWVAQVGANGSAASSTSYPNPHIWQYSWKGYIPGINGDVDMDYCYKKYVSDSNNGGGTNVSMGDSTTKSQTTTATKTAATTTTTKTINTYYRVYTGKWWGEVVNCNDTNSNGYAGVRNKGIQGLTAKVSEGTLKYRVHTKGGKWLNWISKYSISDWNYGIAGVKGRYIDGIQFDFSGISGYKVMYRVSLVGSSTYLPWVTGWNNTPNGYAGVLGKQIDQLQVKIVKA